MERLQLARRRAWLATGVFVLALVTAIALWDQTKIIIGELDAALKFLGLALGPFLAILGFVWGRVDKAEIKQLSSELGSAGRLAKEEQKRAQEARLALTDKEERVKKLEHQLATIADSRQLWKLRDNAPFPEYRGWKYDPLGAKIVTVALFKGGVGKTHLAANFAAYVSEKQQKPVLLIDLDYQGSLSTAVLTAAGIEVKASHVDALFAETADLSTLSEMRIHLAGRGKDVALNSGNGLSRAWIVPADYTLTRTESELLTRRVIHDAPGLDERYRLAHLLLHPSVRRDYAMILIDTPPRMTLGTVNALVASHCYVCPTILDKISSEAVSPFLLQLAELRKDLDLDLELAGIIASMTRQLPMSDTEKRYRDNIREIANDILGPNPYRVVEQNLPRRTKVTNSDDLGYFLSDAQGPLKDRFYDAIFDELWTRIMKPRESR